MSGDASVDVTAGGAAGRGTAGAIERAPRVRRMLRSVLAVYMCLYHRLELHGAERLPSRGPAIVLVNHASLLDVPALMVLDPYPNTVFIIKSSLLRLPIIGWLLNQWGAIAVERQGRDSASVRTLLAALRAGKVLAVAAEGRRTRTGRLQPINPVLARISASVDVPLVPVGISGSFEALPPKAMWPRPRKLVVRVGEPFRLARGTDAADGARRIRAEIAALLPPAQQPLDDDTALTDDDLND